MAKYELFSKRQAKLRGETIDVYQYEIIPNTLRVQIIQIMRDSFGRNQEKYGLPNWPIKGYKTVHDMASREYGVFELGSGIFDSYRLRVEEFIEEEPNAEKVLDIVELVFRWIDIVIKKRFTEYKNNTTVNVTPDDAIEELNIRFKEHGVGFQYEGGAIIKFDSTYIHTEIVKPLLNLLWKTKFKGANEEFLNAHQHYRHGRNKECLNECLKAFESTMKTICKTKGWPYKETDTSKKLINICFQNKLIPSFTQNQFTSLRSLLESGVAPLRNKLGGHGQGEVPKKVDDEMVRYGLNLTGTNIIFLIELSQI